MLDRFLSLRSTLQWETWQRWVIVAALLAMAVYAGRRPSWMLVIAPFVMVAGALVVRRPWLGLLAVVVAGLSIPWGMGTGTQTELSLTVLLIAALSGLLFLDIFSVRRRTFIGARPIWPLFALIGAALVSLVAGLQPWHMFALTAPLPSQMGSVAIYVLSVAAFLLAAHYLTRLSQLRWLVWLFLAAGALYIASRALSVSPPPIWPGNPNGATGSLLWIWLVALAFSQAVFNDSLRRPWRGALLALSAATLGVGWILGRDWVSGWLPPLIAVLIVLWLKDWRVGLTVSALVAVYFLWVDPHSSLSVVSEESYSILSRDAAREALLTQAFPLSPILGLGPANYWWYSPLFPILGYAVKFNSHNNYIDILLQFGLLGMACFAWFSAEIGWLGWRLHRTVADPFARAFVNGALAGLGATLLAAWLGDWLLPFVYNIGMGGLRSSVLAWLFLGALIAIEQMQRRGEV
ncbi:MAG: hypothetical protein KIS91_07205 [Anaerolineae bacterium]|nr:hypothetical protein [Anaerolineae bacterium]